ncbi:MAG: hypothetical protein K2L75_08010 [Muribaculaceae bacterium]|nr:hypothetical protein [Muribaculaceae bacterium]
MTADENKTVTETPETEPAAPRRCAPAAWIAVVLAVAAWIVLMMANGYAAIAVGIGGIAAAIWACVANRGALRRLAIAALIASAVLTIVVAAFIIAVKSL